MNFCRWMLVLPLFAVFVSSALAAPPDPVPPQASNVRNKPTAWDQKAAAKYLDGRMVLWFEKASKLKTGQGTNGRDSIADHDQSLGQRREPGYRQGLRRLREAMRLLFNSCNSAARSAGTA